MQPETPRCHQNSAPLRGISSSAFCSSTTAAMRCRVSRPEPRTNAVMQPITDVLTDILNVARSSIRPTSLCQNFRAPNALINPTHNISQNALCVVVSSFCTLRRGFCRPTTDLQYVVDTGRDSGLHFVVLKRHSLRGNARHAATPLGDGTQAVLAPALGWAAFTASISAISSGFGHMPLPICALPRKPVAKPTSTLESSGLIQVALIFAKTGPACILVWISSPVRSKKPVLINTIRSLASATHAFN